MEFIPEGWKDTKETYSLSDINDAYKSNKTLEGYVKLCDPSYNLHVDLGENIHGIIPRSEVDLTSSDDKGLAKTGVCMNKQGSFVQFKVKDINDKNEVLLSRKDANLEALNWMLDNLHVGDVVKGIVKNIRNYGVFVEIGAGVVGLLHIEDISVSRINSPEDRFKVGQKIDVKIKQIDKASKKFVLSYKELLRYLGRKCK